MKSPHKKQILATSPFFHNEPITLGSIFNRPEDTRGQPFLFYADENINQLPEIEKAIRSITKRPSSPRLLEDDFKSNTFRDMFSRTQTLWHLKADSRLYQHRHFVDVLLQLSSRFYNLSFHSRAFLKHLDWCKTEYPSSKDWVFRKDQAIKISQRFQQSLETLTEELNSTSFKRRVKTSDTAAEGQKKSLKGWMNAAFQQTPKILWVQVQLGYNINHFFDLQRTLKDREKFLAKRQSQLFSHYLVGYIGKLHYLPMKGLVHNMIFLYDARYVQENASLAKSLAEHWNNIVTDAQGLVWMEGESFHPKTPKINGTWSLKTQDGKQRLNALLQYLSHYDTFLHYKCPPHTRTLIKSQHPGKKRTKSSNRTN